MRSIFDAGERDSLLSRLASLQPGASRLWGKMTPAQMLAHLAIAVDDAAGERVFKQSLLGKLVTPLIRSSIFGEKPFGKGAPTHPTYVVSRAVDFETERGRLAQLLGRFASEGPGAADGRVHPFFGKLTGQQWGILIHKHVDHHLRQFGC